MSFSYQSYQELNNQTEQLIKKDTNNLHFQSVENFEDTEQSVNYNGKVYFKENETAPAYDLYNGSSKPEKCVETSMRGTLLEETPLSKSYFSQSNLDSIQQQIIEQVYKNSGHQISRQSDMQAQIIMRSTFLTYGKNDPCSSVQSQIATLNKIVVNQSIEKIIPEIEQYLGYRRDIAKAPQVMPLSTNVSNKGNKTYSLFTY